METSVLVLLKWVYMYIYVIAELHV